MCRGVQQRLAEGVTRVTVNSSGVRSSSVARLATSVSRTAPESLTSSLLPRGLLGLRAPSLLPLVYAWRPEVDGQCLLLDTVSGDQVTC